MLVFIFKYIQLSIFGGLSVLAFSPFNLWWMAIVSLSLAYLVFYHNQFKHGFLMGFAYGAGMFGFGVWWVFYSLHDVGGASTISAFAMTCVSVVVLSLFPGMAFYFASKLLKSSSVNFFSVFVFAALWVLFEWTRSWILTGFPWLLFGHALVDSFLGGVIPILGTYGGSALIVVIALTISYILIGACENYLKKSIVLFIVIGLVSLANLIQWTQPDAEKTLNVAAIQGNVSFEMKWDESQRNDIYSLYLKYTRQHYDKDIIVWPETAIPTYYFELKDNLIAGIEEELVANNVELITGIFTYDKQQQKIFNSLVTLGKQNQFYNKQRLVPFGEFLPFRWIFDFFRDEVSIPMPDLSSGQGSSILMLKGVPVGVSICYESAFADQILDSLPGAELLINVTNDAWFGDSLAPHQHLQIARTRVLETGRYMIRAANTGISAIIEPTGKVLARSGQYVEQTVNAKVYPMKGITPFILWGNYLVILISFLICAYSIFLKFRS